LPDPEDTGFQKASYIAPRTAIEKQLVKVWTEVLEMDMENISIKSDFFDLGGNSINAIKLIISIRRIFEIKLILSDFLLNSELESLARLIEGLKSQVEGNYELEL
jgi:acyl carrier protein